MALRVAVLPPAIGPRILLAARVRHAGRPEMVIRLDDVLFFRLKAILVGRRDQSRPATDVRITAAEFDSTTAATSHGVAELCAPARHRLPCRDMAPPPKDAADHAS